MKYQAVNHPKMVRLGRFYGGNRVTAVGAVESIIALALTMCQRGDVGKFTDTEIEEWCGWGGAPGEMVRGLVLCGWLDEDTRYRLVIHDWQDHAVNFVKAMRDRWDEKKYREPFFIIPIPPATPKYKNPDSSDSSGTIPGVHPVDTRTSPGDSILSCSVLSCSVLSCTNPTKNESSETELNPATGKPFTAHEKALDRKLKAMFPKKQKGEP